MKRKRENGGRKAKNWVNLPLIVRESKITIEMFQIIILEVQRRSEINEPEPERMGGSLK